MIPIIPTRYLIAGLGVALLASLAGGGYLALQLERERVAHQQTKTMHAGERLQASQDQVRQLKQADAAADAYETRIAEARRQQRVVIREVDRVVSAAPDLYARECLDADGLRAVAAAAAGASAPGDPGGTPPAVP